MSRVSIIKDNGAEVLIQPKYGLAMKLAAKSGHYKYTRWISLLLMIVGVALGIMISTNVIILEAGTSWPNWALWVIAAAAAGLFFGKPSQVMVNNEILVKRADLDRHVSAGTEEQLFTRTWA